jgi:3-deoxy-D-manno-octulosonic-acid transferase
VVVVNTQGELLPFMAAADMAIVGFDRNLFEPASQGLPVLYFGGPCRSNKTAMRLLTETGGAREIAPGRFLHQIEDILADPSSMIAGAEVAIRRFKQEVIPSVRFYTSLLIAALAFERQRVRV